MDRMKGRPPRRTRVGKAPNLEALEGRQLLAAGASQVGIREVASAPGGSSELILTGTNRADVINIVDNGSNAVGNVTVRFGDGSTYTSQGPVAQVQVLGNGGNDRVSYTLAGNLVAARTVLADLGAGNDQFTAQVNGAVANAGGLDLEAYGDGGADNLAVDQAGPILAGTFFPYLEGDSGNDTLAYNGTGAIAAGASIMPALSGGGGNDTIASGYSGMIAGTYIYNLTIDGGSGNDSIVDAINVAAGSTGAIGSGDTAPAVVEGGAGNDKIQFAVAVDPRAATSRVAAVAIGGTGKDTVQRTANVQGSLSDQGEAGSLLA
jgi:hypothetical protein